MRGEIAQFLTHLAVDGQVSPSTQNQAFSALLFLYRDVLQVDPGRIVGEHGCGGGRTGRRSSRSSSAGRRCGGYSMCLARETTDAHPRFASSHA